MGKQVTEMLKGTLEGIVLAILSGRSAYGYEITAWLREKGFSDIAEGTVYALLIRIEQRGLVDVEKVPSEKGPPRKVYSLNAQGQALPRRVLEDLELPHRTARTAPRRRQMTMAAKWIELVTGSLEQKKQYRQYKARIEALPEPYGTVAKALERYFMYFGPGHGRRRPSSRCSTTSPTSSSVPRPTARPCATIVGEDPVEFAEAFAAAYTGKRLDRPGTRAADQRRSRTRSERETRQ